MTRTGYDRRTVDSRWRALCKNPADLTDKQSATLAGLRKQGGALWRAYQRKETLRAILADDLDPDTVMDLLARWCSRAQRSRLPSFVKAARTMTRRAYGFHSPEAALALIMLTCGPVKLELRYHT